MRQSRTILLWLALIATLWGCAVLATGGFVWELGWFRLSSRAAGRPFLLAGIFVAFHLLAYGRKGTFGDLTILARALSRPSLLAGFAAFSALAIGLAFGTRAVGGSDSYGYVSQADLWLRGSLTVEQPFVGDLPWENASLTTTPLGYIPTGQAGTYVPMYPPGFPLTIALFKLIGGEPAAFLVVPLLGALAVWLTFQLGRGAYSDWTGTIAAVLLVASPAFLFMLVSAPMSDIPAMAWWLLSSVTALRGCEVEGRSRTSYLVVSGLATSAAIVTRPNLSPLAIMPVVLLFLLEPDRATARKLVGAWLVPALLGPVFLAVFNHTLYRSPISFGYGGELAKEFSLSHVWPNLQRYLGWLAEVETPLVFVGFLAPALLRRGQARPASVSLSWWCLAFSVLVLTSYLSYTVFDAWWYLRFLLPAYPMVLVMAAAATLTISRRLGTFHVAIPALLTTFIVWHGLAFANEHHVFSLSDGEGRYKEVGELVKRLPRNTFVLAFQHSGSLRYYANVTTVRFDTMPPQWLDKAIGYLAAGGFPVYAVLDEWEVELVRKRFAAGSRLSWMDREPIEITRHRVRLYEVAVAHKENGRRAVRTLRVDPRGS